jgi:hypothetical protein
MPIHAASQIAKGVFYRAQQNTSLSLDSVAILTKFGRVSCQSNVI